MSDLSSPAAQRVVIDCDPGHDDAVALLLAAGDPRVALSQVTTVSGNQTLELVTRNAQMAATVAGLRDVPIVAGAGRPLVRPVLTAPEFHGESGLDGPAPVTPAVAVTAGHGAQALADAVLADPGAVTIVATGPLTNLALALRLCPEIERAARRVVLMGGSWTRGNATPAAEFNILVDPEAAAAVFDAGWDVTMIGLDVTHLALFTPAVAARLASIDTAAARWTAELLTFFTGAYRAAGRMDAPPVHDAVAVACVIEPGLVPVRDALVQVETVGRLTAGMTVVDFDAVAPPPPPAALVPPPRAGDRAPRPRSRHHVGVGLDAERFWELVLAALTALP